ncbi:MAG TPA: M23 family metallopeptidase [Saprospiraceae bacterium]|nr:M23 family metallopeptidase [Saprospiraceae bacterium]
MKFYKLIFWIWLGTSNVLFAQIKIQQIVSHEGHLETDHGGPTVCLGTAERIAVQERINKAVRDMKNDGLLERVFPQHQRAMPPLLQWPLRQSDKYNDPGYYAISNYVDLDPTPVNVLDYNGLNQTYDGHNGIDIRVWPYWWKKMDDSHVEVVAAADGIIIFKQDGFNDQSCAFNGNSWNAVFLLHADGSITWYGHLKQNSTTVKDSGDVVTVGEYLGVVGSSGNSTNPHLHLECYDDLGNRIEPFAGTSNPTITNSWWANQLPYYDTGVNKIATHFAAPVTPPCPGIESPNEKDYFNPGDSIFFTASIRHSPIIELT